MSRIATFPHHNQVVTAALNAQEAVSTRQVQVSTGYKDRVYTGVSEDSQRLVNLESQVSRINQYIKNGETAELRLNTMENAMEGLVNLATRVRSLLIQGSSGNVAEDLNLNAEAKAALQTVETTLNSRLDGRYLFAGSNTDERPVDLTQMVLPKQVIANVMTDSRTSPLSTQDVTTAGNLLVNGISIAYDPATDSLNDVANNINSDATLRSNNVTAFVAEQPGGGYRLVVEDSDGDNISLTEDASAGGNLVETLKIQDGFDLRSDTSYYQGDQQQLETRLDDEFNLEYGILADESGFESLIRGLRIAANTNDEESLSVALNAINTAITELPNIRSEIGIDLKKVQEFETTQQNFKTFAEQSITEIEAVDVTATMALLSQDQTQLQASYLSISRLSQLSLTNYL